MLDMLTTKLLSRPAAQDSGPRISFRQAESADADAIATLAAEIGEVEGKSIALTREALARDVFGPESRCGFQVAVAEDRVIGFGLFYPGYDFESASWGMHVSYIIVHQDFRHRGVASALLRSVEEMTRKKGGAWVSWTVPSSRAFARRLYRSFQQGACPSDNMQLSVTSFRRVSVFLQ